MYNPPHPGLTLKDDILPALELTATEASEQLGVTRAAFSRVINCKAGISPEMALRIEAWLGEKHGGSAGAWLALKHLMTYGRCVNLDFPKSSMHLFLH
jgi:addiction module HigA family antidote